MFLNHSQNTSHDRFRFGFVTLLATFAGCSFLQSANVHYLGTTNARSELETPSGFVISPADAARIKDDVEGPDIFVGQIFHDDRNYYIVRNGLKQKTSASEARLHGTIIDGRTGGIYDRSTDTWKASPNIGVKTEVKLNPDGSQPEGVIQRPASSSLTGAASASPPSHPPLALPHP